MTSLVESFALWLADYYLLASMLLAVSLAVNICLKQPAQRLAITKSTVVALVLLAALSAVPGWSVVHLLTSDQPRTNGLPGAGAKARTSVGAQPSAAPPSDTDAVASASGSTDLTFDEVTSYQESKGQQISWPMAITIAHASGAVCVIAWLLLGSFVAHRLCRGAQPAPAELVAIMNDIAERDAAQRAGLYLSNRIEVAVALGILRPTILLPKSWNETQSRDALRTVLAHELAHLRHRDLHWLAASRVLLIPLWAQPLYWLLRRRMRLDQESLADAAAAEFTSRQQYAEQLVTWARQVPKRPVLRLSTAIGFWERPSELRQRIALLLNEHFTVIRNCSRAWRRGAALVAIAAAALLSLFTIKPDHPARAELTSKQKSAVLARIAQSLDRFPRAELQPGPVTINGRCQDGNGNALAEVDVALFHFNSDAAQFSFVGQTKSGASGRFRFANLEKPARAAEGNVTYWIIAWSPGRASALANFIPHRPRDVDVTMPAAETLRGRITDAAGRPVEAALVRFGMLPRPIEGLRAARTDSNGEFAVTDLGPTQVPEIINERFGGYRFRIEHPDFATASVRYQRVPDIIDVVLQPAAVISGTVLYGESRSPAAKVHVMLQGVRDLDQNRDNDPTEWSDATTDETGRFRLRGLRAGKYNVWATAPDWTVVALDSFEVRTGETREAPSIKLVKGGFVAGRFVDDATGKTIRVGDESVLVGIYGPSRPRSGGACDGGRVNADGTFRFRLPPGKHYVYVSGRGPYTIIGGDDDGGHEVNVRAGETTETEFRVAKLGKSNADGLVISPDATANVPVAEKSSETTASAQPIVIPIVVAKHVMLHEGKIIDWADVERMIAALPNPTLAHPSFIFTDGALPRREDDIRAKIWDLRKRVEMQGHSWGSLLPRASARYDAIRTAADLVPNEACRIEGMVQTPDGLQINGAEVVLLLPAPESLQYKTLDVYLRNERLRTPEDEIVTRSDNAGRFAVYPQPNAPYYLVALHREGFGLVRSNEFVKSHRIVIQPWADVKGRIQSDERFEQSANITVNMPAQAGWPELSFHQYSEDLGPPSPEGRFELPFIPPSLKGTLSRSVKGGQGTSYSIAAKEFQLAPGKTLMVVIEPPSDAEATQIEDLKSESERRRQGSIEAPRGRRSD